MFDELMRRKDVSDLLDDICNSVRYYDKNISNYMGYQLYSGVEQIIFLFYDALFKYNIIIKDMEYFDDFLEQVDKLIKRIDNFSDVSYGINRLIGRICAFKLGIKNIEDLESKNRVLRHIYSTYMISGYYIHGYSSHYYKDLLENGLVIEEYNNLYEKFIKVQNILKKRGYKSILDKDFSLKKVDFTDSFLMGCYYSVNAPMFFSKLLCRNEFIDEPELIDAYSINDYNLCLKNLYRLMSKINLNEWEKSIFLDAFKSEWNLLDKSNSNISLLLVPKMVIGYAFDIEQFINDNSQSSFVDSVCKLLSQKNSITVNNNIDKKDITFVNLYNFQKYVKVKKKETIKDELEKSFITSDDEFALLNTYGKVSVLLLLGAMLITLGVVFTVIMFS